MRTSVYIHINKSHQQTSPGSSEQLFKHDTPPKTFPVQGHDLKQPPSTIT